MTLATKTRAAAGKRKPASAETGRRTRAKAGRERSGPKRYTVSDGELLLNLETEGEWFIVTSPLDPELVTQARTIEEAFRMAYDARKLLEGYRAGLAREAAARRNSVGV